MKNESVFKNVVKSLFAVVIIFAVAFFIFWKIGVFYAAKNNNTTVDIFLIMFFTGWFCGFISPYLIRNPLKNLNRLIDQIIFKIKTDRMLLKAWKNKHNLK